MDTTDLKLNENEQQMFGQLFTLYGLHETPDSPTVPQSVAKQLLNASHLEAKLLDQIMDLLELRRLSALNRHQFYAMLKLVGAAQSGLPLNTDTLNTNALTIPLPQLSPIVVDTTKQQLIANNIDDINETSVQMTGHLPPPPTKSSVRSNRRNNQLSNNDQSYRQPVDSHNNYNSLNNNLNNNYNNNHNENSDKSETESEKTNSRSSSANDIDDDSPVEDMIDKSYDYRDKSWSEFNEKKKDKPLNWADFDEEHHLLEDGDEDEEEERDDDSNSTASSTEEIADIWKISEEQRAYYTNQFKAMQSNINGIITGNKAKDFFEKSNLPIHELSQIWLLSDIDKDGALTLNEFCVAMHLVVLRRNQIELPAQLPPSLLPAITPVETKHNPSLNSSKSMDLITDCEQQYQSSSISPKQHHNNNDLIQTKAKSAEPLSPQNKVWTKFNDSPTHQIVVTAAASPPSTSSSAGIQTLANFDFNTASIVRDPKILHPVAVRLSPDGQPIRYDNNEVIHNLESSPHLISLTDGLRPTNVIQGKKDPPPPPPPRPQRSHTRSSSLDLNRIKGRSGVANDLISSSSSSSQIPSYLKVSNSEYGLTAPHKEIPNLSLNQSRNLGAFQAYRKTRTETSLKNNNNNIISNSNSVIDALRLRYKIPAEVAVPDSSADSTQLWQTVMSFQEYSKTLENINIDLLRELNKANEEKHSLELRLAQVNTNGCKL